MSVEGKRGKSRRKSQSKSRSPGKTSQENQAKTQTPSKGSRTPTKRTSSKTKGSGRKSTSRKSSGKRSGSKSKSKTKTTPNKGSAGKKAPKRKADEISGNAQSGDIQALGSGSYVGTSMRRVKKNTEENLGKEEVIKVVATTKPTSSAQKDPQTSEDTGKKKRVIKARAKDVEMNN